MTLNKVSHSETRTSHVRWTLVWVMCVASFISYILRTNVSVASDAMMSDLKLSEIQLGFILSAHAWGYAIFQFPGGIFGDVFGLRKSMTIAAVIWTILTILTAIVPGPAIASISMILISLIVIRFLVGAAHAPIFPIVGGTIGNWFPVSSWALPNGLTSTALTIGIAATAPLFVWLMKLYGWRGSFWITAPLGLLTAALWWIHVRDYPVEHAQVSKSELELIDADRPPPLDPAVQKGSWKIVIRDRNVILLTISYFCMNYIFYLFFNWFFYYLVNVRSVSEEQAGVLTASQWIVSAVGATLGGYLCDRFAKRFGPRTGYRILPVPALIVAAILLAIGAITRNAYIAVTLFAICGALTQLTDSVYWGATVSVAERHASSASGVMNTGGNAVGGVGALLVPLTAKYFGWVAAIATGSVFAIVAAVLWLFIKADEPLQEGK